MRDNVPFKKEIFVDILPDTGCGLKNVAIYYILYSILQESIFPYTHCISITKWGGGNTEHLVRGKRITMIFIQFVRTPNTFLQLIIYSLEFNYDNKSTI